MKSIKEKSEEYAYTNWQSDDYHDGAAEGLPFDAIGHTQKTFEAGANYVLDHLSKTIAVSRDGYLYDNLKKMIEQLKN